jgi:Tfp pilus assembly protein PilF
MLRTKDVLGARFASAYLTRLLPIDPFSYAALYNWAIVLEKERKNEQAAQEFRAAQNVDGAAANR